MNCYDTTFLVENGVLFRFKKAIKDIYLFSRDNERTYVPYAFGIAITGDIEFDGKCLWNKGRDCWVDCQVAYASLDREKRFIQTTIDIGHFEDYLGLVVTDMLGKRSTRYKWYDMYGNPLVLDEVERLRDS